jgi:WD40 repeat protein
LWDRARNTELAVLGGTRGGQGSHVAWSPTGRQIATASDGSAQVWDVTDPHHPVSRVRLKPDAAPHPGIPDRQYLYFSHDGRRLAVEDIPGHTITVFDAATGHEQWSASLPATGSSAVVFSPDDTTLAISFGTTTAGQVTFRDAATGAPMRTLQTPSSGGVEFLLGGRVVMTTRSSAEASAAQLWDAATLTPIGEPLPQPYGGAYSISRNAAGTTAVSGSSDGFAVIWNLDITRWEASACRIAGRNLTQDEWRQYLPNQKYRLTCPQWPAETHR